MVKFFEPEEEVPANQQEKIRNQKLDEVVKQYDCNYGNCILSCTHKKKFNQSIYIPGIICAGLCYTMPLIIPSGLKSSDPSATVFNSREKAYAKDNEFKKKCDLLAMKLIYEHQQREHIELMNALETVLSCFHQLLFHKWIHNNTPVNTLTGKAHEMIWHQRLIHLSPSTIKEAYKHVEGIPNLSHFDFDDITNCTMCTKANLRKNSLTK